MLYAGLKPVIFFIPKLKNQQSAKQTGGKKGKNSFQVSLLM